MKTPDGFFSAMVIQLHMPDLFFCLFVNLLLGQWTDVAIKVSSVGGPDSYVFGPPGSGSVS